MNTRKLYQTYVMGWEITIVGCALWTYGYFAGGSFAFLNWAAFAPKWIADYLPNWQAEVGLLLTILGSIPVYIAQIQAYRHPT